MSDERTFTIAEIADMFGFTGVARSLLDLAYDMAGRRDDRIGQAEAEQIGRVGQVFYGLQQFTDSLDHDPDTATVHTGVAFTSEMDDGEPFLYDGSQAET